MDTIRLELLIKEKSCYRNALSPRLSLFWV